MEFSINDLNLLTTKQLTTKLMPQNLKAFLRKIGVMKPCPVKHYRKEDLDFIFKLYNTDNFTRPFEHGEHLTFYHQQIGILHKNLNAHRDSSDDNNSEQANMVFRNLGVMVKMNDVLIYDIKNWQCFTIDALRYNCTETINDLLDEYNYEDGIINHRLFLESRLLSIDKQDNAFQSEEEIQLCLQESKLFLTKHRLSATIAEDYFRALQHNELYR